MISDFKEKFYHSKRTMVDKAIVNFSVVGYIGVIVCWFIIPIC